LAPLVGGVIVVGDVAGRNHHGDPVSVGV
jgi:hypothetical protein